STTCPFGAFSGFFSSFFFGGRVDGGALGLGGICPRFLAQSCALSGRRATALAGLGGLGSGGRLSWMKAINASRPMKTPCPRSASKGAGRSGAGLSRLRRRLYGCSGSEGPVDTRADDNPRARPVVPARFGGDNPGLGHPYPVPLLEGEGSFNFLGRLSTPT